MAVTFVIPAPLLRFTAGERRVPVQDAVDTLGDAILTLSAVHPGLRDCLLDDQGRLRRHLNLYLDGESARFTGDLQTPVRDGAEIFIVPAVSGGARG
jgi:molybdopterin converting factor small subunit